MLRLLAILRRRTRGLSTGRFQALTLVAAFLVTRLVALAAVEVGAAHPTDRFQGVWTTRPGDLYRGDAPPAALEPLVRWDALYYVALAREGYPETPVPNAQERPVYHAAFFPLYPILVALLDRAVGETFTAALLVSNLCALAAALAVARLGAACGRAHDGTRAALLFLASPGAHFLSLPYPEALFALLTAGALWCLFRERLLAAAALGALASASRPTGVVVAIALLASAWPHRRSARAAAPRVAAALLSLGGLAAYAAFCRARYGDLLYFSTIQAEWGRAMSALGPLRALFGFGADPDYYAVAIAALVVCAAMVRTSPLALTCSAWFLVLVPLATGTLKSLVRFQAASVPLMCGAGRLLKGRAFTAASAFGLALMAYEAFRYGAGYANN